MKIITDFEQRTDEWFTYKLGKFGATDAQAIATNGKGLETLCFEKVSERLTGKPNTEYINPAMENGNTLEEEARNAVELEYGTPIMQVGLIEMNEHVVCSPDGLVKEDGLVEIKCPTNRVFVEYLYFKKIDPKYFAQMQMQMLISERKWVDYALYNPNFAKSLVITRVERDEEMINKLKTGIDLGIARITEILSKV
ncbi:MAG TPA: YqaJ viral recombinase family protein [Clostridia bacterium]